MNTQQEVACLIKMTPTELERNARTLDAVLRKFHQAILLDTAIHSDEILTESFNEKRDKYLEDLNPEQLEM